jgi:hypothetical protein
MSDERERDAESEKPELPAGLQAAAPCPECRGSGRVGHAKRDGCDFLELANGRPSGVCAKSTGD